MGSKCLLRLVPFSKTYLIPPNMFLASTSVSHPFRHLQNLITGSSSLLISRGIYSNPINYGQIKLKRSRSKIVKPIRIKQRARLEIDFKEIFKSYPELEEFGEKRLRPYIEWMDVYLFNPNQAAKILLELPSLINEYEEVVPKLESALRSIGLDGKGFVWIVCENPDMLMMPPKIILNAYSFLNTYFSMKESLSVIMNCSEALPETESELIEKLDFLIKKVCHTTESIANSKVLSYPMKHIKMRHEFLLRSGLFKVELPYEKLHKGLAVDKAHKKRQGKFNPHNIVCTSDKEFLSIFSGGKRFNLNHLAAFEEVYFRVIEEERDLLLEGDSRFGGDYDEDLDETRTSSLIQKPHGTFTSTDLYHFYY